MLPITKVRIILPKGKNTTQAEILKLEDKTDAELQDALENHFFESGAAASYAAMYSAPDSKTVDDTKVQTFLNSRAAKPVLASGNFNGDTDLDVMGGEALAHVGGQLSNPNAEFELLPDGQPSATCDRSPDNITREVLQVQAELSDFLLNYGTTAGSKKCVISRTDALDWVNARLPGALDVIVEAAKTPINGNDQRMGVIFHEPHHQLTPGMLLLDQLFRRMVKEVSDMVMTINQTIKSQLVSRMAMKVTTINQVTNATEPNLKPLQDFVEGLSDPGSTRDSKKFRTYIHPPGDADCQSPSGSGETYHVDPPRIEVFLSDDGQIQLAALVVGAWAGGTHSSGHK